MQSYEFPVNFRTGRASVKILKCPDEMLKRRVWHNVLLCNVLWKGLILHAVQNVFYGIFRSKKISKRFGGTKISSTFASFLKHKKLFYYLI